MSSIAVDRLINYYDSKIAEMQSITYGGTLRSLKGTFVETLCENMVVEVWRNLGGKTGRIYVDRRRYPITDGAGNEYRVSQDKQVYVDGQFILSIECKAYAEVAMYKRILVDSFLLQSEFPNLKFCLFQLESMLGGDYATDPKHSKGSPSVRVLDYFFSDVDIEILTLLDGERDIQRPIHKKEFYKPMKPARVEYAMSSLTTTLYQYL